MSALVTRGYGASIPLVVLRGYTPGAALDIPESASTANLREYMLTEVPRFLGGDGLLGTELASIIGTMAELGETVTIAGTDMDAIGTTPPLDAFLGGTQVEGRVTRLYVTAADYDGASATQGSSVTFRSVSYTIGVVERMDGGLVRLELER